MSDKTSAPAFPNNTVLPNGDGTETTTYYFGITMLDYFAAKAMPLCTNTNDAEAAKWCYDRAKAMIAEREKRK